MYDVVVIGSGPACWTASNNYNVIHVISLSYKFNKSLSGDSSCSFMDTRNVTASLPSSSL